MAVSSAQTLNFVVRHLLLAAVLSGCCCGLPGCHSDKKNVPAPTPVTDPVTAVTGTPASDHAPTQTAKTELVPLQMPTTSRPEPVALPEPVSAAERPGPTRVRLPDDRPQVNEVRIEQSGIRLYKSKRLLLLSDLPQKQVVMLPKLADELFDTLETHFGQLPDAIDDSEFQVTGHLISDEAKFRAAGLMPSAAFTFQHGKHVNYEFWMFNPSNEYYRRHLLLHEFTHCFMTCESGMQDIPPLWYIEGMAEFFATHRVESTSTDGGTMEFGILPDRFEGFEGWGRISEFRRSFEQTAAIDNTSIRSVDVVSFTDVTPDVVTSFDKDIQYASSWAVCLFLNSHPAYREPFRSLAAIRRREPFIEKFRTIQKKTDRKLAVDWLLFAEVLLEGFDSERAIAVHADETFVLDGTSPATEKFQLFANRGWQDSGLRMERGQSVRIECEGRFSVDNSPKEWISEPQGVTIEYVRGLPLGRVVAVFVDEDGRKVTNRISVGNSAELTAPFDGSLWLQINDTCNSRANNSGDVEVQFSLPK